MSCIGGALHYLSAVVFDVCRTGGMSAVFGSEDSMVNIETWRAVHILRGHTGGQYSVLTSFNAFITVYFFNGTEWPYVFWSAVKKLLTHYSLQKDQCDSVDIELRQFIFVVVVVVIIILVVKRARC